MGWMYRRFATDLMRLRLSLWILLPILAFVVSPRAIAQTSSPSGPEIPAPLDPNSVIVDLGDRYTFRYSIGGCEEMAFDANRSRARANLATSLGIDLGTNLGTSLGGWKMLPLATRIPTTPDPWRQPCGDRAWVAASLDNWSTHTAPGQFRFQHTLHFNCCARLALSPTVADNTITIVEHHQGSAGELCRCTCDYTITGELHHLTAGRYQVRVYGVAMGESRGAAITSPLLHEVSIVIPPPATFPPSR